MKPTRAEVEKLAKELREVYYSQFSMRPLDWRDTNRRNNWRAVARHVLKKGKK